MSARVISDRERQRRDQQRKTPVKRLSLTDDEPPLIADDTIGDVAAGARERALDPRPPPSSSRRIIHEVDKLLVTRRQAAVMLSCSRAVINGLVADGRLHPVRLRPSKSANIYFKHSEVVALVEALFTQQGDE